MSSTPSITSIWTTHGSEFIAHEVLAPRAAMPTAAKNPDLVYKIVLLQKGDIYGSIVANIPP